jgi:hypothetical protein
MAVGGEASRRRRGGATAVGMRGGLQRRHTTQGSTRALLGMRGPGQALVLLTIRSLPSDTTAPRTCWPAWRAGRTLRLRPEQREGLAAWSGFQTTETATNNWLSDWATAAATGSTVELHNKARFTPSTRANAAPPMRRLTKTLKSVCESLMQCCYGTWGPIGLLGAAKADVQQWLSLTLAKRRYRRREAGSSRS